MSPKKLVFFFFFWVSKDIPSFLAPTPSRGRPPRATPPANIRTKKFGSGFFFLPCLYISGGGNLLSKFTPISFFRRVYEFFEMFQDACCSIKENPSVYWEATLSCPFMALNYANSYLVLILDADHALDFLSYLVFRKRAEYCFESTVSEKRTH